MKLSESGFTLIEVLVTMTIIGILAALVYPSYQDAIRKAKRAEGRTALLELMQQEERYYSLHTTYIVFSATSSNADEKRFKWFSGGSATASAYEIDAAACPGDTIQNCIVLTAKPGTAKVNASFSDPHCGSLSITSTGLKSPLTSLCW